MYYISRKLDNNCYEVTDTKDGVSEIITYKQLVDYICSGVSIKGTSFSTYEDLKVKGFYRIDSWGSLYCLIIV